MAAGKESGEVTALAWEKEHKGVVMCLPHMLHQGLRGLACTKQALDAREAKTVVAGKESGEATALAWEKEHKGMVICLPGPTCCIKACSARTDWHALSRH